MKPFFYLKSLLTAALVMTTGPWLSVEAAVPQQGISLQSTRLIYPETKLKGVTFTVQNNALVPYLIQSRISDRIPGNIDRDADKNKNHDVPFIVLPPLKKLAPDEQLTLVIRLTKNHLPKDRESVFSFHIKAIPARSDHAVSLTEKPLAGKVQVTLALQNTLKLFYRPYGLARYDVAEIADSLRFSRQGKELLVTNPSPFYITFHSLSVGNTAINSTALFQMVPPYGQHAYPLTFSGSGDIRWQLVNDYGQASNIHTRPLTP